MRDQLRSWRQIAEQASQEQDTERLLVLCQELEQALQEEVDAKRKPVPDSRQINEGRRSA
jgi:hypothetical protein